MARKRAVNEDEVREFAISAAVAHTPNLAKALRDRFGVSHGTAHKYIKELLDHGVLRRTSKGRYTLRTEKACFDYVVNGLEEHEVWARDVALKLKGLPANAMEIWNYGCSEMLNNVIDHSESPGARVRVERDAMATSISVIDRGVGIFRKISRALGLDDDRHAVLELTKGKVTTDPVNHTGEGIFFSSRAFDDFCILSGGIYFRHRHDDASHWILGDEEPHEDVDGTSVYMTLNNDTESKLQAVFDEFTSSDGNYGFDKTVVPVKLLKYGDDLLVSRSQGKRLLQRFDRFKTVILDFEDVDSIGQAFADQVFRVFPSAHPDIDIVPVNANEQVTRMIRRAMTSSE